MCPNVQAICIFVVVIREKLEIIFHQTLGPNVENTCKDTDHFHKKNQNIPTLVILYLGQNCSLKSKEQSTPLMHSSYVVCRSSIDLTG